MKRFRFRPTRRTVTLLIAAIVVYGGCLAAFQLPGIAPVMDECAMAVDIARQMREGVFASKLGDEDFQLDCQKVFARVGVPMLGANGENPYPDRPTSIHLGRPRLATWNLFARDVVKVRVERTCGPHCGQVTGVTLKRREGRWAIVA